MELDTARQAIRPNKEHEVMQQLQNTYGKRFDSGLLAQGQKDVAGLLGETSEPVSIHKKLRQPYGQLDKQHRTKRHDQKR